ncbi:MAG: hypothetical protein UHP27_09500, partial [Muribaculaceae bacterium]|nr:hypothetical protein [Muribaculaceae bacterium]
MKKRLFIMVPNFADVKEKLNSTPQIYKIPPNSATPARTSLKSGSRGGFGRRGRRVFVKRG